MTACGLLALALSFGIGSLFAYHQIVEMIEFIRILHTSYRLASTEVGSSLVYARFTFGFCKVIVAGASLWRASDMICRSERTGALESIADLHRYGNTSAKRADSRRLSAIEKPYRPG